MSWKVSSANATLPITTAEAKLHLKVDDSADDTLIDDLIAAAKDSVENYLNTYLYNTTITEYFDAFPSSGPLRLTVGNVSSVTSVTYTDANGNTGQTFSSSSYVVDSDKTPAEITLADGESWPDTLSEAKTATVTYVVGYGANAGDEPSQIKTAALLMIGHWYHNRNDTIRKMPTASEYLLNQERLQYY